MKVKKYVSIITMPLTVPKEEAFACALKDKILVSSICKYRKLLESEGKEVFARKDNIIICEDGYYFAFFEDDIVDPIPFKGEDGRMKVIVHGEKKTGVEDLAKMVASAFIPNPCNYPDVSFRDNNPENVAADNLYWTIHKKEE